MVNKDKNIPFSKPTIFWEFSFGLHKNKRGCLKSYLLPERREGEKKMVIRL
jgi:hypothetical protein